jgi:hypothetical protein
MELDDLVESVENSSENKSASFLSMSSGITDTTTENEMRENDVSKSESDAAANGEDGEGSSEGDDPQSGDNPDTALTYRPIRGEDIYGRIIDSGAQAQSLAKYVPPNRRDQVSAQVRACCCCMLRGRSR